MNVRNLVIELGIAVTLVVLAYAAFPVFVHSIVFEYIILNLPLAVFILGSGTIAWFVLRRYGLAWNRGGVDLQISPAIVAGVGIAWCAAVGSWWIVTNGLEKTYLAEEVRFAPVSEVPRMDIDRVRYIPEQVAAQEIVRRTQTSQHAPGSVNAIGTGNGVVYIAPLVVQGGFNMLFAQNKDFMLYDDAAPENERVTTIHTDPWTYGEGMEFLDNLRRQLILQGGFFHSYPSSYYGILTDEGTGLKEVIGIFPYLSYHLRLPGVLVPHWGGVAIVHANGTVENLTPETALADPRLSQIDRLFPRTLARWQVEAQRYDQGWYSGYIRRNDKIEVPELPGNVQMPFYLPVESGYAYVTMVEPDGDSFALRKIFVTDARTGVGQVYTVPMDDNILGPDKAMSYAKSVQGFNWYEEHGTDNTSGSYRIIEPRPIVRNDRLHYMYSITPVDYASVVATVFVDAVTNEVAGPFRTREETSSWLHGRTSVPVEEIEAGLRIDQAATGTNPDFCVNLQIVCEEMKTVCK